MKRPFLIRVLLCGLCCCYLSGCITFDVAEFAKPEFPPYSKEAHRGYYETELNVSNSADVLSTIYLPDYELLSQSKNIIASFGGKKKKGYKRWFKMVAFDEDDLKAKRKYLFIEDERPKFLFIEPWEGLKFDCEMMLASEILEEPYANENARRIAILRAVMETIRSDIREVAEDNKALDICGMMVNQSFENILVKLDSTPAIAKKLSDENGITYNHMSLKKAKIRMVVTDDIAIIKLRAGAYAKMLFGGDL